MYTMSYHKISFDLSQKQRKSIADAASSGSSVRIKFTNKQLYGNNSSLLATQTQIRQMEKAKKLGKGVIITISKKQISHMQNGGFLPVLLGALVSSLAPVLFNKVFPDKSDEGRGINMPGSGINMPGSGINLPGKGMKTEQGVILPANGEDTSYHVTGFSARNAGIGANAGLGIVIPGTQTARRYQPKALGMPKKKQRPLQGMGFISPNSEKFQMLE